MKNVIKFGFLALSFGLFAVACGGGENKSAVDSTANAAGNAIDSVAQVADSTVKAVADSAHVALDSTAAKVDSAVKH